MASTSRLARPRTPRAPRPAHYAPLLFLLLAGTMSLDCAGSGGSVFEVSDAGATTPPSSAISGTSDVTDNGKIAIDKLKLVGSLDGGMIKVIVPVCAVDPSGASGTLRVRLLDVQGVTTAAEASLPYTLGPGAAATFQTSLPAPAGLAAAAGSAGEADLVNWNVRVDDDTKNTVRVTRSLLFVVPAHDVRLEGPSAVTTGKGATYRVRTEDALTRAPVVGASVGLDVTAKDGSAIVTLAGVTGATGEAFFPLSLPLTGDYQVGAHESHDGIAPGVADALAASTPGAKTLLTSDKPIYQPGQTMQLRTLTLTSPDSKPVSAVPVLFEVLDGKGNKVLKQSVTTDSYGVASTAFTLGTLVNEGTFTLRATSASATTEKTVSVSTYALPKFGVTVNTDKTWYRAGDTLSGTVDAQYFFGKTVAGGDVAIKVASLDVGQTVFQNVMGTLDSAGHFAFTATIPSTLAGTQLAQGNATIALDVTVTDTAGQVVEKDTVVTVSPDGLNVALVPEGTQIAPGLDNELDLFVTDPLGAPVQGAAVAVTAPDGQGFHGTTDAYGQTAFVWHAVAATSESFSVSVAPAGAAPVTKTMSFTAQSGSEHLLVRTDASIYNIGDTVNVDIATSDATPFVYVDWINAGQAVDQRTLDATAGHATFTMSADASLGGSNRIDAYVVDATGNVVRAGRTVYVKSGGSLTVSMTPDKPTYAPGDSANLTFAVQDSQGQPAVAALGVEIVDQAVFALVDAHPGLLQSFFDLESIYATPTYEIAAPPVDFNQLLFAGNPAPGAAEANQNLTKAAFAALGESSISGIAHGSWTDTVPLAQTNLQPDYAAATSTVSAALHPLAQSVLADLVSNGCDPSSYTCMGTPVTDLLTARIVALFSAWDFWGNPYAISGNGWFSVQLTTNGPDEIAGTADDKAIVVDLSDLASSGSLGAGGADGGVAFFAPPQVPGGFGGGGFPGGGAAGAVLANAGAGGSSGGSSSGATGSNATTGPAAPPRVRQDFPETLYVNPSIITGPDGIASVNVPLADSITQWRVSTMANSADGKLGGGESGFTVFQDFFVDINFPATLTRGDQVTFPIAIYNYLSSAQTVALSLAPDTWYTPAGPTTVSVTMQPGEVTGASFPVTVNTVGLHSLTVKAVGTSKSDAVARSVLVVPDGQLFADTFSGVLPPGTTLDHSFQFPSTEVPGSQQLYVEVYPAFLSQGVSGMQSILREPSGCFEQTTSTTWPNVLVLAYLAQTNMLTPDVQLKAQSLISTGYQRLLTFEHPGGGFSWFGTQDPAALVSVTAFGLMEFSDMAKVASVDDAMIARTRAWLVAQQQADGSWNGDRTEFFSFNTSTVRNTAFVIAALASSGYTGPEVAKGIAYLRAHTGDPGNDAYTLALMADALELSAPGDAGNDALYTTLDTLKLVAGDLVHWNTGGTQTVFYQSGGDSDVSTTGMVTHALIQHGGSPPSVDGSIKYIAAQKDPNGNFGSTQATIWALRALLLAASKGTDGAVGTVSILVDGAVARTVALTADQSDVMTTVDLSGQASAGTHDVGLSFAGTGRPTFNAVGKYNLPWSLVPAPPAGPLSIAVAYDKTSLYVNDTVKETVTIHNNTTTHQNMILATVGVPPGFSVTTADLDALVQAQTLSKYELTGKQIVFYVSQVAPSADVTLRYGLQATMPVVASDGASEVHLYYQPSLQAFAQAQTFQVQ